MASTTAASGRSTGKVTVMAILAVIGIVAIIAAALYLSEPAKSLPSLLGTITSPAARANAKRSLRGEVSLAFGVICLIAAGITAWRGKAAKAK